MINIQSSDAAPSPVEAAGREHATWFIVFVVWAVVSALVTASLTYFLWRASNKQQDVIQAESNARIAEAGSTAAQANERAEKLENDNLVLRGQVATLETQAADAGKELAGLQKAASDALAAQQRVETELARQQERTAEANKQAQKAISDNLVIEASLEDERRTRLELEKAIAPREIWEPETFVDSLKPFAGQQVTIVFLNDFEAKAFAFELSHLLESANWNVTLNDPLPESAGWFDGIAVETAPRDLPPPDRVKAARDALIAQLFTRTIIADTIPRQNAPVPIPENGLRISVGLKPMTYLRKPRRQ